MPVITFNGTTIYDSGTNGAGYTFTPNSTILEVNEVSPDIGIGYFLKPGNITPADHQLVVHWRTQNPASIMGMMNGLQGMIRGTLSVPVWGNFPNTRLSGIGEWSIFKTDAVNGYIVSNTLTFRQYP